MNKTIIIILAIILIILILLNSFKNYQQPIGGCAGTLYGCCQDKVTTKMNYDGTNCS